MKSWKRNEENKNITIVHRLEISLGPKIQLPYTNLADSEFSIYFCLSASKWCIKLNLISRKTNSMEVSASMLSNKTIIYHCDYDIYKL